MIKLAPIIQELIRIKSWADESDYDLVINTAYDKIKKYTDVKKEMYNDYKFLIKEKFIGDEIGIVLCKNKIPFGFATVSEFENGVQMVNIGIKPKFRGQSLALIIYGFIINKYKFLYSDIHQSPESRKAWLKLSKKYNIKGYDTIAKKLFDVSPNEDNTELKSDDQNYILYKDNNMDLYRTDPTLKVYLVAIK